MRQREWVAEQASVWIAPGLLALPPATPHAHSTSSHARAVQPKTAGIYPQSSGPCDSPPVQRLMSVAHGNPNSFKGPENQHKLIQAGELWMINQHLKPEASGSLTTPPRPLSHTLNLKISIITMHELINKLTVHWLWNSCSRAGRIVCFFTTSWDLALRFVPRTQSFFFLF